MRFSWNPAKAASNATKHGVAFAAIEGFDWETALVMADVRHAEPRLVAIAPIGGRVHVLVFSIEHRIVRVISLRKANRKEILQYATA